MSRHERPKMMYRVFLPLLACVAASTCRDTNKIVRTIPTISNSLVNLGKMDISFYFNGKPQDFSTNSEHTLRQSSSFIPKFEPITDEPCPCSNFRNIKDSFLTNPSEIMNTLLRSNDFFSNKEPASSTFCCDTHEHVEDTVFLEIAPNQKPKLSPISPVRTKSFPPSIFDTITPNRPISSLLNPKAVEIFFFPKRKDIASFDYTKMLPKKNVVTKDGIRLVGDNVFKNDIKPAIVTSSVKKDLTMNLAKKGEDKEVLKAKEEKNAKLNAL